MKTISLTIPLELNALTRASDMLHGLALDLSKELPTVTSAVTQEETQALSEPAAATIEQITAAEVNAGNLEPAAADVFASPKQPDPATVNSATETVTHQAGSHTPSTTTQTETVTPAPVAVGVDTAPGTIDPNVYIPWDHRIHASSKAKLAKKPNGWKMKRGVDASVIAQVETELRAAMVAGPANPVVPVGNVADTVNTQVNASPAPAPAGVVNADTAAAPAPAPTAATTDAVIPANPAPAPAAVGITTFPALMAAITTNALTTEAVTVAVNSQGLASLPLLAARPDLIPAVALALGV